jgi:cell division protein FtsZ
MSNAGSALMGIGSARGEDRARAAAEMAVSSPLLEANIDGAHGVLLSIAGGSDLGLFEVSAAANLIQEAAHEDANIIFGTVIDDSLGDEVRVTVIAAGFDSTPSVLPPSIDQRARAATSTGSGPGPNGNGFSQAASRPVQPQYSATTLPPAPRPPVPAYQQQAPGGHYQGGTGSVPVHQGVPTGRNPRQADLDDDDVDVPSFMKR